MGWVESVFVDNSFFFLFPRSVHLTQRQQKNMYMQWKISSEKCHSVCYSQYRVVCECCTCDEKLDFISISNENTFSCEILSVCSPECFSQTFLFLVLSKHQSVIVWNRQKQHCYRRRLFRLHCKMIYYF